MLCRRVLAAAAILAGVAFGQEPTVVVNGVPVVMRIPLARLGDELFLPLAPIARALNADLAVGREQTVHVRRSDGALLTYDGRSGEIRTGAVLAAEVRNYRLIHVVAEADQLLFPVSAIPPLFAVNVR